MSFVVPIMPQAHSSMLTTVVMYLVLCWRQMQDEAGSVESEKAAEAQAKAEANARALHSAEAAKKRSDRERAEARARDWDEEEVRMLQKALVRYPQGTAKRWEQVGIGLCSYAVV